METKKSTKKVELQKVQVPTDTKPVPFDRKSMGYTDRPINSKLQSRNNFLEVNGFGYSSLTTAIASGATTVISFDTVSYKSGSLMRKVSGNKLYCPKSGTYQITGFVIISTIASAPTNSYGVVVKVQLNGSAVVVASSIAAHIGFMYLPINGTFNINKDEYLEIKGTNDYTASLDFNPLISAVKLS